MDYWVCMYCWEKFPNLLGRELANCPNCGRAMELYEPAATPITPDLPIILTGLRKKKSD